MLSNLMKTGNYQFLLNSLLLVALCGNIPAIAEKKPEPESTPTRMNAALAKDLELYQGTWELLPSAANQLKYRSVKTVKGNRSTVRRYAPDTGELVREHTSTFELLIDGGVRVNRFRLGKGRGRGFSFIYKVDQQYFYEATGLLQNEHRSHTQEPKLFKWTRIPDPNAPADKSALSEDRRDG